MSRGEPQRRRRRASFRPLLCVRLASETDIGGIQCQLMELRRSLEHVRALPIPNLPFPATTSMPAEGCPFGSGLWQPWAAFFQ